MTFYMYYTISGNLILDANDPLDRASLVVVLEVSFLDHVEFLEPPQLHRLFTYGPYFFSINNNPGNPEFQYPVEKKINSRIA